MDKIRTLLCVSVCALWFGSTYCQVNGCKKVLEKEKGWFKSPNYPWKYPNNNLCTWQIHAPDTTPDTHIKLEFVTYKLKRRKGNDYVEVYDGPNHSYPLLGRFNGDKKPLDVIESTQNWMFVKFVSDAKKRSFGFNATYHTYKKEADTFGPWIDASLCTAKPCNCSQVDRIEDISECSKGKVLQVRACKKAKCPYQHGEDGLGLIRMADCYNLNKLCPSWSEYKPEGDCDCTKGEQNWKRFCNSPAPSTIKCYVNDRQQALEQTISEPCTCEEETLQTTEQPSKPAVAWCPCSNKTSITEDYDENVSVDLDATTTSTMTTSTTTAYDPYGLNIDYNDEGNNLCLCNETIATNGTETSMSGIETTMNGTETFQTEEPDP